MLNGISEEHKFHGDYARFHVVVLKLFLHKLLHFLKFGEVLIHWVILPNEVTCVERKDCSHSYLYMYVELLAIASCNYKPYTPLEVQIISTKFWYVQS